MATTRKSAQTSTTAEQPEQGFTAEERAAMKERAKEVRTAKKRGAPAAAGDELAAVLEKFAEMNDSDREMAERVHAVITASAPELTPRLWYGMPGYAKDGKLVCFFQPAQKFKARYSTLGFNDPAQLDDGDMWPTSYALMALTPAVEKQIGALVKKAAG
ncbi:DUF1801 domain-containing protein [Intrasporangium mesophilum]